MRIHRWTETQEELRALAVPVDTYDGTVIHTFAIEPNRCSQLRSSVHPQSKGELLRLQCSEPVGHVGDVHFFHAPDNKKPKKWRD
jgi:hypothetical protein